MLTVYTDGFPGISFSNTQKQFFQWIQHEFKQNNMYDSYCMFNLLGFVRLYYELHLQMAF